MAREPASGHREQICTPVPLNLLHACTTRTWVVRVGGTSGMLSWVLGNLEGGSATERVLAWERCQQRVIVRVSGKRGVLDAQPGVRSQGPRQQKQTVDLLKEWLHGAGSSSGTEPLPCLGGFGSALFQRLASFEGLSIVVLKCKPPLVPVEARDTPGLTPHLHRTRTMGIQENTRYSTRTILG